ncbi:hypothetical protein A2483_04420 [Candidatus Peregrinibacteria bacterium RIFOXYC2_FULL_33_13]|nr:MAG: hypothetical protein UR27_C0005G0006 [Candidatus Peregrinibacteria bacterium GW2011_GWA2_33_10]KKP39264.1 MAG: hypothetical protein UR30_C0011G0007 [Candidatus Peregrinibacteria bacterium GW2011_GWC2_33_13]OGJ49873.1 MAG: hypothetical protein A2229_03010 [Candidatus Peregrinibacteria bacterium RIFOXYA2_FULL_33_7]OGJ54169.1 MAG: hypothetical protein A2483_04420 [Candidatus Peregrinibacteria bacterium RIFOXYC2_FULL_33_13]
MNFLIKSLAVLITILITARLLPGIQVKNMSAAIIGALVLALINTFVKPVLLFLTLPINVLTLGLFTIVLNALLVMLADRLVSGFEVKNFWWAVVFSLVLTLVSMVVYNVLDV